MLVVSQIAVTVALVAASGLLAQSLWSVRSEEPGFVVRNVLVADLSLPGTRYAKPADIVQFEQRLVDALGSLAGVNGVATAYDHPLESNWTQSFRMTGDTSRDAGEVSGQAELRIVSPGYFDALGVEVLDGRRLTELDGWNASGAAVVNEAFARRFGAESPVVGRRLQSRASQFAWGDKAPGEFVIVGIVENERFRGLEQPALPAVYLSTRQFPQHGFTVLVRTDTTPLPLAGQVRAVVRSVDVEAASGAARSLEAILSDQLAARRVTTDVIGGFAGAALGLAALGLYGLLAVVVAGRTREIGVRLALGASPRNVARHVVIESLGNVAAGVAVGIGLALLAGRLLQGLLVGVTPRDPATLAIVAATLAAVGVAAALGPATRAARVDPARALRAE
jgi:predicted permease